MDERPMTLVPFPRFIAFTNSEFRLVNEALIVINSPDSQALFFSARQLQGHIEKRLDLKWEIVSVKTVPDEQIGIVLSIVPGAVAHNQGYGVTISERNINILASTTQGIFYGVQTVKQLVTLRGRSIPTMKINDWPDFPNRGVMLDISRDKVPTMDTLYSLIDLLSSWKINQLQLYTEHTFAYRNHPVVWAEASPMTGEEIMMLDIYCQERFVELVPNQNSFGHMRRWLVHEAYRHLAECPRGCDTEWGLFDEPFTLYPGDPASFDLIRNIYDELLPHFSSQQVNVGCDETVDLGSGRSKGLANDIGTGQIYLDFLMKIYRELKARGFTMQFWGDIMMNHPELVSKLPKDVIALEWGYEADHPFDVHGARFAESGVPFYVCPGTSSWNAIGGRTQNAVGNLVNAAKNGLKHGAVGFLNTDWGDNGHWQSLPVSYLGFAFGAGISWSLEQNREPDVPRILDLYAFQDEAMQLGSIAYEMGRVHEVFDMKIPNSTILFRILQAAREDIEKYLDRRKDLEQSLVEAIHNLNSLIGKLNDVKLKTRDADLLVKEYQWIGRMLLHACYRVSWYLDYQPISPKTVNMEFLLDDIRSLHREFRVIWHARNRPGGFKESANRLVKIQATYE